MYNFKSSKNIRKNNKEIIKIFIKEDKSFIPFVGPVGNGDNPPPAPIRTAVKLQLQDIASFSCSESEPATAAKTKSSNNAPVILWKSAIFKDYSPKTRCAQVSARFEAYRKILGEGKTLFITGTTGFVGKVVLEKILRSLSDIKRVYVMVRAKKGFTPMQRLSEIFSSELFTTLF